MADGTELTLEQLHDLIKDMQQKNSDLETKITEVVEANNTLNETIEEQGEKIKKLSDALGKGLTALEVSKEEKKLEIPKELVERENKEYKWKVAAFHLKGYGKVTAEQAATDDKIIDAILEMKGQQILIEQV